MNDTYIFLGPTLEVPAAQAELDAIYLPPVAAGDVYRLRRAGPRAIGIVDGYFDRVPAVWHKEILCLLEGGVHVFGSASMGALRAVELGQFGMCGVGWVYHAFKDGTLEADDEVAVSHTSGPDGYRARSEAMVNIRRTLHAAHDAQIISGLTRDRLTRAGKALHYPDRTWPNLLAASAASGAGPADTGALHRWLPAGRVDQQAADAVAMLAQMRRFLATDPPPHQVRWRTETTARWHAARQHIDNLTGGGATASTPGVFSGAVPEGAVPEGAGA
jgi:hypothetical protein